MKKKILAFTLMLVLLAAMFAGCGRQDSNVADGKVGKVELKSFKDQVSYMIGTDIGASLVDNQAEVDPALVGRGIADRYLDRPLLMTNEELDKVKEQFSEQLRKDFQAKLAEKSNQNLTEGKAYLAENAKKPGVVTTASGLQYEVVKQGKGPKPGPEARVKVHYRGTLLDGTEFDSSYQRDEPVILNISSLIPGWAEALQLMPVGSTYKITVPAELAYGDKEVGPDIGPNATLKFEIELLGIE